MSMQYHVENIGICAGLGNVYIIRLLQDNSMNWTREKVSGSIKIIFTRNVMF